jgi:hypothetical protein
MRLRNVGPGIGGLNYDPLLRQRNEKALRRALARLPNDDAELASLSRLWKSISATAKVMGERVVAARMAQAQRLIEVEQIRLSLSAGEPYRRGFIGARYY